MVEFDPDAYEFDESADAQIRSRIANVLNKSKEEWKIYDATSRYEIRPDLVKWYYPPESYLKELDLDLDRPQHTLDDEAINLSNIKVLEELVPEITPPDSYFQKEELEIIESWNNPLRAPCRHHFGLFTSLSYCLIV
jgi:hypothetical protein